MTEPTDAELQALWVACDHPLPQSYARAVLAKWGTPPALAGERTMTEPTELLPCPFCGAGESQIHVNKGTWNGRGYGEPVSVEVRHWCADVPGQPSRMISRAGRDEASAIAAWNTRTTPQPTQAQPTQAQAGAVPLTREQVKAICVEAGYETAALQARADFINGIRHAERHHGIKGGQHGAE